MAKLTASERMWDAIATGDLAAVKKLVAGGFDLEEKHRGTGETALSRAGQQPAIARFLVEAGAKVDAKDRDGQTPLFHVYEPECAEILLAAGADASAHDKKRNTPLHLAACRSAEIVKALAAKGAEIDARNKFEQTPLHVAVAQFAGRAGQLPALKALLALGADKKAVSSAGHTPLALAKRDKKAKIVALL